MACNSFVIFSYYISLKIVTTYHRITTLLAPFFALYLLFFAWALSFQEAVEVFELNDDFAATMKKWNRIVNVYHG